MTVGKYPFISLQEAREKSFLARKEISEGIDPTKKKNKVDSDDSFSFIFREWFDHKKKSGRWSMQMNQKGSLWRTFCPLQAR
ncbi:prophage Sf6-like integrase [Serratia sp. M24T3]|nr:prophage Sf6-like integrase [Serratia sp. M24T3]